MQGKRVLVIDDDLDVAEIARQVLEEEGWWVDVLTDVVTETIREAVDRFEPDCILLDGAGRGDYGQSWLDAAKLHARARPIPVIMFSASRHATDEAQAGVSARSVGAAFAAVLPKPFDLDVLAATVAAALGRDGSARWSR